MRHRGMRGFTLVEAVVALVILAAATAGVLLVFAGPMAASADPMVRAQARALASSYVDEIRLRRFGSGPGDCSGTSREDYDTIWCYDGLNESPTNQFGESIGELSSYTVSASVDGDSDTATILVNVTHSSGRVDYTLETRRASF